MTFLQVGPKFEVTPLNHSIGGDVSPASPAVLMPVFDHLEAKSWCHSWVCD